MKEWIRRALRTALQTAVGCIAVALPTVDWTQSKDAIKASLMSIAVTAISAGLAAFMNYEKEDEQ